MLAARLAGTAGNNRRSGLASLGVMIMELTEMPRGFA